MKKFLRFVWSIVEFVVIVYVIIMTAILLSKNKYGYTQFGNVTLSTIDLTDERAIDGVKSGDLLIVRNSNDIKEGDVIYYYVVYGDSYLIQSDPVKKVESDRYNSMYTIERNGSMTIASNRVLGKNRAIYHNLGAILDILESRLGFLFLVLLPILVIFIFQVYELVMIFKYQKVDGADEEEEKKEEKPTEVKEETKEEKSEEVKEEKFKIVHEETQDEKKDEE